MKKISGQLIARLLHLFRCANEVEISKEELLSRISAVVYLEDLYCEIPSNETPVSYGTHPKLDNLDKLSFDTLNVMLPWSSYFVLSPNQIIGSAWSETKRNNAQPFPDKGVVKLAKTIDLSDMTVLELGCFEGHHSVSLAQFAKTTTAVDGRIENIIKTLTRVWAAGMERRVIINLINLERGNLQNQLKKAGLSDRYDLIYHRGVLYHLSSPIENLLNCAEVCSKYLYLHTQIAPDSAATDNHEYGGKKYSCYKYKEPKVNYSPFSGICDIAIWLTRSSLIQALNDTGFNSIKILSETEERNGPRIELIAEK